MQKNTAWKRLSQHFLFSSSPLVSPEAFGRLCTEPKTFPLPAAFQSSAVRRRLSMKYSSWVCKCILQPNNPCMVDFPGWRALLLSHCVLLRTIELFGLEKIFKSTESNCTESRVTVAGMRRERCTAQRTVQNKFRVCLDTDAMGISWIWQMD